MDEQALVAALGEAVANEPAAPAPKPARAPSPELPDEGRNAANSAEAEAVADEIVPDEPAEAVEEPTQNEPEFLVEVDGEQHVVRGEADIKAAIQQGLDYGKKSRYVAAMREANLANYKAIQESAKFQQAATQDIAQLQAIEAQLRQFEQIDWSKAFDSDAFNALKMKEQRDQLREMRNAKVQEFSAKQQQFKHAQAQAAVQLKQAEEAALLSKVPEWRDHQRAATDQAEISKTLEKYEFQQAEIAAVMDHRIVVLLRDLVKLQRAASGVAAKQVRQAPPVVKPGAVASPATQAATKTKQAISELRSLGRKGDHRAQEAVATKLFERAFK